VKVAIRRLKFVADQVVNSKCEGRRRKKEVSPGGKKGSLVLRCGLIMMQCMFAQRMKLTGALVQAGEQIRVELIVTVCTAMVVLCTRPHSQSSGRGIIAVSKRPSKTDDSRAAGGHDDEEVDREEELYHRYIAPWRPQLNASHSRSAHYDADSTAKAAAGGPRVSQLKCSFVLNVNECCRSAFCHIKVKVKAFHIRHRALGPELIPVYRQSAWR